MTRLLAAEANRWLARRSLWATLAGTLVVAALICAGLFASTMPPSGAEVERGRAMFQQEHAHWVANAALDQEQCRRDFTPDPQLSEADQAAERERACVIEEPKEEWFVWQPMGWHDATMTATVGGATIGALGALLMAASFWGAEYRHGSLSTWLTFVPSRGRVWASKMLVAMVMGAAVTAIVLVLTVTMMWAAIVVNQGAGAVGAWDSALANAGRGLAFGAFAGLLGGALTTMFRNTVAAVAVPMGYLLVQGLFGVLSALPGYIHLTPWLPENNVRAFLEGGLTYPVPVQKMTQAGLEWDLIEKHISFAQGAVYLVVLVGLVAFASAWLFQRRDVTE